MAVKSFSMSGIRVVAIFEALKSGLVVLVGFGLLSLINHDVGATAEWIVRRLHLNPVHRYPRIFLDAAHHVTDVHLWLFASLALTDAVLRGVTAYGLWYDRQWAKWLGVITAGVYVPLEIYEIVLHVTTLKLVTLVTNILIVVYLGSLLYIDKQEDLSEKMGSA